MKKTLFKIMIALIGTMLYTLAGALDRGWIDTLGTLTLLTLIAPLTYIWIITDEEEKEKE